MMTIHRENEKFRRQQTRKETEHPDHMQPSIYTDRNSSKIEQNLSQVSLDKGRNEGSMSNLQPPSPFMGALKL